MIVYHGSNADIEEIDLTKGSRFKDFGQGFYATPDLETAQRMARKKAKLFGGEPTILVYEFQDEKVAESGLKMRHCARPHSRRWCCSTTHKLKERDLHPRGGCSPFARQIPRSANLLWNT